jgi:hypothetical protein
MHYGNACGCQDDRISVEQFDRDQQQRVSSQWTLCDSLLQRIPDILCTCLSCLLQHSFEAPFHQL